jgi:hypothetical protein
VQIVSKDAKIDLNVDRIEQQLGSIIFRFRESSCGQLKRCEIVW